MRPALYLCKVHPINFIIVFLWSFFGKVYAWRVERIPESWHRFFTRLSPDELFSHLLWFEEDQRGADLCRRALARMQPKKIEVNWGNGRRIDLTQAYYQHWCYQFKYHYLFLSLVRERLKLDQIDLRASWILSGTMETVAEMREVESRLGFEHRIRFARFLDLLWNSVESSLLLLKWLAELRRYLDVKTVRGKFEHLWCGISESEIPFGPDQLDFSFAQKFPIPELGEISSALYVLPRHPSRQAEAYLSAQGIQWIVQGEIQTRIPRLRRLALLGEYFWLVGDLARNFPFQMPYLATLALRALACIGLSRAIRAETYWSSLTSIWPEPWEAPFLKAEGMKTKLWYYASSETEYVRPTGEYQNRVWEGGVSSFDEILLWTHEHKKIFTARQFPFVAGATRHVVAGPMMCGNRGRLNEPKEDLRKEFLKKLKCEKSNIVVSIFDWPLVTREVLLKVGMGPKRFPVEMAQAFYADMLKLLHEIPNLRFLIKPKRNFNDVTRIATSSLRQLVDAQGEFVSAGLVECLDEKIDPFLPVALADICIGFPFASPVVVALETGRVGYFYDPLSQNQVAHPPAMNKHLKKGFQEIKNALIG